MGERLQRQVHRRLAVITSEVISSSCRIAASAFGEYSRDGRETVNKAPIQKQVTAPPDREFAAVRLPQRRYSPSA
jgi:hypothetical protein